MKNVFGFNVTDDKNNTTIDGQVFIRNTVSAEMANDIDKAVELMTGVDKKSKLPGWMQVIQYVTGILAVMLVGGVLRAGVTPAQAYRNVPYFFYCGAIFFLVWLSLTILGVKRKKNVLSGDERNQAESFTNCAIASSREALSVPPDAESVDILTFAYKIKNGKMKMASIISDMYVNLHCAAYVRDNSLHLAFFKEEFAIPLDSIAGIKKINKRIYITGWNKETPLNKGEYKQYKIKANSGLISFKPYYVICVQWGGEDYEWFVPPYELDTLSSLIGLDVEEFKPRKKQA